MSERVIRPSRPSGDQGSAVRSLLIGDICGYSRFVAGQPYRTTRPGLP
jgi:hypothetical protein